MLVALADQATATRLGDTAAAKAAGERVSAQEDASLYLVGDDNVARAYREFLVSILSGIGQALTVEDQVHSHGGHRQSCQSPQ